MKKLEIPLGSPMRVSYLARLYLGGSAAERLREELVGFALPAPLPSGRFVTDFDDKKSSFLEVAAAEQIMRLKPALLT